MSNKSIHGRDETRASRPAESTNEIFGRHEIASLAKRLRERATTLREDIRAELLKYDDDQYQMLADRVGDYEDKSVADLLTDVDLSEVDRDVQELRDIEAALVRVAEGTYGICVECQEHISYERLEKVPGAARCRKCQERYEKMYPHAGYPTL